jgi:hypothetical protein
LPTIIFEPGGATSTPLPDRGVRVVAASEVVLRRDSTTTGDLRNPTLDGDSIVAEASSAGRTALVSVDLDTGQVRQLLSLLRGAAQPPRASGGRVAWIEPAPDLGTTASKLQVMDVAQGHTTVIATGSLYQLDLKDDVAVWQELRGQGWGVYAYGLTSGQRYIIADDAGLKSFPYVCNRDWSIYLRNGNPGQADSAELRAHNLATDRDISIGQVPLPKHAPGGNQHACDGNRVAWIEPARQTATGQATVAKQHIYDLATSMGRALDVPGAFAASQVQISGDTLLVGSVGYDLQRDVPFDINFAPWPAGAYARSLLVSGNRLALIFSGVSGQPQRVYTASIARNPQ